MNKTKDYLLVLAIAIILFLSAVVISAKSDRAGKIDPKVLNEADKEGKARAIVILKEPSAGLSIKNEKQRLEARAEMKEEVKDNLGSEKITHEFSSMNAFSASLSEADLKKLESDSNVESIYYDIPVKTFLQDSVQLINATKTWSLQSGGTNLTGKGETICIIDTGVDYTHPSLGNCTPVRYEINGTNESYILESAHNYTNYYNYTWNITKSGYSKIGVHFVNISTEARYDYIYILDGAGKIVGTYSGGITNLWSPSVDGDTIYIQLKTDELVTDYGFYIDQVINGTTNRTYDWSGCSKVVGGWDTRNSDPDPRDDNGHGTHVSGIAAANGSINGVAPEAKLISIKALDSAGNGVTGDVVAGIEWCTNRSADFNISVISMSLGSSAPYLYSNYCDSSDPLTAAAINAAVAKNITVVIAAGNDGNITHISQPACIQNATPIGSIQKNDLNLNYNRNWMVQLLAPGYNINSTCNGGGYCLNSGTSMATPHAAGAFAITSQYLRLNGKTRTPQQIESALNSTGKVVYDSNSGLNYSRINLYDAIVSLDFIAPNVTLVSPEDNYSTTDSSAISFQYNVTDNGIMGSCALILNGAISDYNSSAISTSATNTISKTLSAGNYNWSINCSDIWGNTGNSSTRSLSVSATPTTPSGGGGGGSSQTSQIYTASSDELSEGYSQTLKAKERVNFKSDNEDHSLTINKVGASYVEITINSSPINLVLKTGESKKINFDSDDYYDLLIRLESIIGIKANVTIKSINEKVESVPTASISQPGQTEEKQQNYYTIQKNESVRDMEEPHAWGEKKVIVIAIALAILVFLVSYFYAQYKKSFRHLLLKKHIIR